MIKDKNHNLILTLSPTNDYYRSGFELNIIDKAGIIGTNSIRFLPTQE